MDDVEQLKRQLAAQAARIARDQRMHEGQTRLLEMIARAAPLRDTLTELSLVIESQSDGLYCSVLLLDEDGVHIHPGAGPRLPDEYMNALDGYAIGPEVGSCGTAMYCKRTVIVTDVETDPLWAPYKQLLTPHGFRACWSSPIWLDESMVLGSFAMYYREVKSPDPEDMKLLGVGTHIAGIAIERHRRAQELERHREHLEELVAERTAQLKRELAERQQAEMALMRAHEALATANQELEAFSYSVSHDLRAPLRKVDGFSQMLEDDYADKVDDTGRDYIQRIRAGSRRMGELIDDMMALSRVAQGDLQRAPVDLGKMAGEVLDELQAMSPDRRVARLIAPALQVSADARLLRIALENLLGNAWKYTSKSEHACIEVGQGEREGETVYFVRDNGAGFDARSAAQLFKPFQRFHAAAEFEGTGIGLATEQRIVMRHGGRVWCESAVGRGSTFFFTLPSPVASSA